MVEKGYFGYRHNGYFYFNVICENAGFEDIFICIYASYAHRQDIGPFRYEHTKKGRRQSTGLVFACIILYKRAGFAC